jgi:hypothetical protein
MNPVGERLHPRKELRSPVSGNQAKQEKTHSAAATFGGVVETPVVGAICNVSGIKQPGFALEIAGLLRFFRKRLS